MTEPKPCPWGCSGPVELRCRLLRIDGEVVEQEWEVYHVCKFTRHYAIETRSYPSEDAAVAAWNRRTE